VTSLLNECNIYRCMLTDKMTMKNYFYSCDKNSGHCFVSDYKTHLSGAVCASVFKGNGEGAQSTLMDLIKSFLNPLCLRWTISPKCSVGILEFQWRLLPSKISTSCSKVIYGLQNASNSIIHCKIHENVWWFPSYWQWRWHIQTWQKTADQDIKTFWSVLS
jgi:hypothetical protein